MFVSVHNWWSSHGAGGWLSACVCVSGGWRVCTWCHQPAPTHEEQRPWPEHEHLEHHEVVPFKRQSLQPSWRLTTLLLVPLVRTSLSELHAVHTSHPCIPGVSWWHGAGHGCHDAQSSHWNGLRLRSRYGWTNWDSWPAHLSLAPWCLVWHNATSQSLINPIPRPIQI